MTNINYLNVIYYKEDEGLRNSNPAETGTAIQALLL